MATNRDLLKEAIADAKAVKETAIANAKAALEEAFTPFLKEKLSAKLAEMEVEEEKEMEEEGVYEADKKQMDEMGAEDKKEVEEVSLDELLAELEEGEEEKEKTYESELNEAEKEEEETEEMSIEDMSEEDLKSFIEDVIKDMVSAGELEAGESMEGEEEVEAEEETEEELDEEVNLDEILSEDESEELEEEVSLDELLAELEEGKDEEDVKEAKEEDVKEELEEAYATIETLKSELQEINLLNAKLLYTNKIFRNKSLTESQKVKVLSAFDKATSKKEVQLVYETLQESFKASTAKAPIKESLGSASKVLGGSTSKPIIENDAFARMRELAGLKK